MVSAPLPSISKAGKEARAGFRPLAKPLPDAPNTSQRASSANKGKGKVEKLDLPKLATIRGIYFVPHAYTYLKQVCFLDHPNRCFR
jgi:hypothetical protein